MTLTARGPDRRETAIPRNQRDGSAVLAAILGSTRWCHEIVVVLEPADLEGISVISSTSRELAITEGELARTVREVAELHRGPELHVGLDPRYPSQVHTRGSKP